MDKLDMIREQKQQLRKKIMQLQGQKSVQTNLSQQAMAALLQKKAKLEHQRLQQEKYRKMQEEYNQRKAQLQRQKKLEKIRNEKRMIELQVGMKKIVLNGVQEKVKGINSDQLLTRAMLQNGQVLQGSKLQVGRSKNQIKNEFEKYLLKENIKKEKPKHDLYQLNQKRIELFEKKEELLMREVLLKEIINKTDDESILEGIDVMACSREELQRLLEVHGIDIENFKHPLDSKIVIQNFPKIEETIRSKLNLKKQEIQNEEERSHKLRAQKAQLKDWVRNYPNQASVKEIGQILDDVLLKLVFAYEKRHFPLSSEQKDQKLDQLQKEYEQILFQNQFYELAEQLVEMIERKAAKQIVYETVQQVHQLHEFAHETTEMSFDWLFGKNDYLQYLKLQEKRLDKISLNFKNESENIRYDKNERKGLDKLNPDNKDSQTNVFQTQKLTSELINDIKLLSKEEQFFNESEIQIKREIIDSIDENDFKIINQAGLYVISTKGIKLVSEEKDISKNVVVFQRQLKNIKNVKKFNNLWLIQTNDSIYIHSAWNLEVLPGAIGQRINGPCGYFTNIQIFPSFTLLGSLCTVLISFQKGQLMKYNFNRNRLNSTQNNLTHYFPLGPSIKTGDQPAFPLNNRNVIESKIEKTKEGTVMHEFREFFDFHTTEIINVCYYKDNMFVTVDKTLNCAIWFYDLRRGIKSYEPYYTFKVKCDYKTFKESQNPRFKDLYPSPSIPETGQELYKKWMENETYLKLQIYNNPKKNSAYFKSPKWDNEKDEQPVWKINYDQKSKRVIKIFQTYYNLIDGKVECRQVKIWKEYVMFLVEKEHTMRSDLKTVKIYTWSVEQRKLRTVAIQFDTFQQQRSFSFEVIQNKIQTNEFPLIVTISSGKILLFSMLSGQLLKDVSEEQTCSKLKNYNFTSIQRGFFDNFYGVTRRSIVQFIIKNKNSKQKKAEFNKVIDITRKKYNNLI